MKYYLQILILSSVFITLSCGDYIIDLPNGYKLISEAPQNQMIWPADSVGPKEKYIPCNVNAYGFDKNFIIAKQVPDEKCFFHDQNGKLENPYNQIPGQTYFWIIEVNKKQINGPFAESQFQSQLRVLSVPEGLRFDRH